MVCLACSPLLIIGVLRLNGHTGINYLAEQVIFYFASVASILNLTAIAIDRYDAVTNATKRRLDACISYQLLVVIWATSGLVAAIIFMIRQEYEIILLAAVFFGPFTIMLFIYRKILSTAAKSAKLASKGKSSFSSVWEE